MIEEEDEMRCDLDRVIKKLENRIADQSNIIMLTKKRADFELERSNTISSLNDRLVKENGQLKKALRVSKSNLLVSKKEVDSLKKAMDMLMEGQAEKRADKRIGAREIEILMGMSEELKCTGENILRMNCDQQKWSYALSELCEAMKAMINHLTQQTNLIFNENASLKQKLSLIQDDTCNQVNQWKVKLNRAVDEKNNANAELAAYKSQISCIKSEFDANRQIKNLRAELEEARQNYRILREDFDTFKEFSRQQLTLEKEENHRMRMLFN